MRSELGEHLAGVEDAQRVEGRLEAAHQVEGDRVGVAREFLALQEADAVLGGDLAVQRLDDVVHDSVEAAPKIEEGGAVHLRGLA